MKSQHHRIEKDWLRLPVLYMSVCAFGCLYSFASFPIIQSYTGFHLTETVDQTEKGRLIGELFGRLVGEKRKKAPGDMPRAFECKCCLLLLY